MLDDLFDDEDELTENDMLVMMTQAIGVLADTLVKGDIMSKYAKVYKKLYDELIIVGFSEEQAIQITAGYSMGKFK